jgi:hypothetical protein
VFSCGHFACSDCIEVLIKQIWDVLIFMYMQIKSNNNK